MRSTIRQHAATGLVAAAVIAAAFPQGLFQPTGYAAASIVIWAAVVAGVVGRSLPATPIGRLAAGAALCLAAIAILATISVGWATDQGRAFEEAVRASLYLGLFTLAACTASPGGRRQWVAGLCVGLVAVTAVAVFAYLQPGILDSGHSDIPNAGGRLSYPLGYWNAAAALMAATAILLAHAATAAPSRALRAAATAGIPLAVLGIWLATSRGGAVALAAGLIALMAASPRRSRLALALLVAGIGAAVLLLVGAQMGSLTSGTIDSARRADGDWMSALLPIVLLGTGALAWWLDGAPALLERRRPRLRLSRGWTVAIAAAAVAIVAVGIAAVNPAERFREFKQPPTAAEGEQLGAGGISSHGRWQYWGAALDAFENDPVAGVGAGGYENWWARHPKVAIFVRNPHSLLLQDASELGVLGLIPLLGFFAAVAVAARRRLAAGRTGDAGVLTAVVVAGGVGALIDWAWQFPAAFAPAVVCAGLLTASALSRRLGRSGYWLGIGTVATAWVAMVAGGLVVLSHVELSQSRHAAADGHVDDAISHARAARTIQPWSAAPYTQLALLEEIRGNLPAALEQLHKAQARDAGDWRLVAIEARLLYESGNGRGAVAAFHRAQSLSPVSLVPGGRGRNQG